MINRTPQIVMKRNPNIIWTWNEGPLFTFDDGPGEFSIRFGELIAKNKLSAVFFIVGKRYNKSIVNELIQMNHHIGWHSNSHTSFLKKTDEQIQLELDRKEIETDLGYSMEFFRFPYGYFRRKHVPLIEKSGLKPMMWTYKCDDYKNKSIDKILKDLNNIQKSDIVLLHDYSRNVENTYSALRHYFKEN